MNIIDEDPIPSLELTQEEEAEFQRLQVGPSPSEKDGSLTSRPKAKRIAVEEARMKRIKMEVKTEPDVDRKPLIRPVTSSEVIDLTLD